ncbi:phosphatase PAP2 family protein [Rhizobium leucaenae]|uniref:Undecaprenyl-diphosphatase n=1 Tax=Rhizobium leucaenae TaxID=29450 RepID=A0A7W6ZTP7_9HYPH|nr:phosphatase PAP2 family protein [Rhizobium leucaenae]MBB4568385.1 undecaprenyl-diphosphatase [Rhizobium leucaenae]MBB6300456.1 undecaprenyl-diphosphatase [Rhizobium leucaenae]
MLDHNSCQPLRMNDHMDQTITQWINSSAGTSPMLDRIMIMITQFGVPLLVLAVALQWWSGRSSKSHVRHACIVAGLSFLIGLGVNQIILVFLHRIRPYDAGITHLIIDRSADWSFPSDHATATFSIVAAFLLCGLWRRGMAFFVVALLICLSRIYVGTHYITDILGGAATAIVSAAVINMAYREDSKLDRWITGLL